jgi:hypothetical protein
MTKIFKFSKIAKKLEISDPYFIRTGQILEEQRREEQMREQRREEQRRELLRLRQELQEFIDSTIIVIERTRGIQITTKERKKIKKDFKIFIDFVKVCIIENMDEEDMYAEIGIIARNFHSITRSMMHFDEVMNIIYDIANISDI